MKDADRNRLPFYSAGLVLLVLALYSPSLKGGDLWDDVPNIRKNETLRDVDGLRRIWSEPGSSLQYYPLTYSTFWLEAKLWNLNPVGTHLVNILLHGLNAVLLGLALRRLGGRGTALAALLFALHPLQAESVSWMTERKNVLSAFFYLCALHAYLRSSGLDGRTATEGKREQAYTLALALYVCALLSKSAVCVFPAVLVVLHWWKQERLALTDLKPLGPFAGLGLVMGSITIWMEHRSGLNGEDWAFSFADRFQMSGRAVWFYLWKWIWPADLTFIYPREPVHPDAWPIYLFPIALIGLAGALWVLRRRLGKIPFVVTAIYIISLGPALGWLDFFFMKYSFVADRFQYLASMAPAGGAGALLAGRWKSVALAWALVLGVLTWHHQDIYRDEETLWRDTVRKNPEAWMAWNNLGGILARRQEFEEAILLFRKSIDLKPNHLSARINLGTALARQGLLAQSIEEFREALKIDPEHADAHYNLGTVLARSGETDESMRHFRAAIQANPDHAEAHHNLGIALAREGRLREAMKHFGEALRIKPDFSKADENLRRALAEWEREELRAGKGQGERGKK